ncbi:MAG: hypothetical protein K1X79_00630 [Oligoflexia bacterium]|nr:hypothetical protein [Oligoflexia bacterium]
MRTERLLVAFGVLLSALHATYLLSFPAQEYLARFAVGDAMAYARVAFNIAAGRGSTFDLDSMTNGYHPLWMWMNIPVFYGAHSILDRFQLLRALWIASGIFAAIAWARVIWLMTRDVLSATLMLVLVAVSPYSTFVLYSGLETSLVLFFSALLVHFIIASSPVPNRRAHVCLGLLLACTFLSRLDSVLFLMPFLLLSRDSRKFIFTPRSLYSAVGFALPVLPYLVWNVKEFGSILPVSGQVKTLDGVDFGRSLSILQSWGAEFSRLSGHVLGASSILGVLLTLIIVLFLLLWRNRAKGGQALTVILLLVLGALAHYAYYCLFMRELNVPWHVYPQFVSVSALVTLAIESTLRGKSSLARIAAFLVFTTALAVGWGVYDSLKSRRRDESRALIALSSWFLEHAPVGARITMYDSFLLAAYLPDYNVSDLNGLVGNQELALLAKQKSVDKMVLATAAQYVIAREPDGCPIQEDSRQVLYRSPLIETTTKYRLVVLSPNVFIAAWQADQDNMCPDRLESVT